MSSGSLVEGTTTCPAGSMLVGGGFDPGPDNYVFVFRDFASTPGKGGSWTVKVSAQQGSSGTLTIQALCAT